MTGYVSLVAQPCSTEPRYMQTFQYLQEVESKVLRHPTELAMRYLYGGYAHLYEGHISKTEKAKHFMMARMAAGLALRESEDGQL